MAYGLGGGGISALGVFWPALSVNSNGAIEHRVEQLVRTKDSCWNHESVGVAVQVNGRTGPLVRVRVSAMIHVDTKKFERTIFGNEAKLEIIGQYLYPFSRFSNA